MWHTYLMKGLIPANGEIWRVRRRALVPALHKKYLESMINLFGDCGLHGAAQLEKVFILDILEHLMHGIS